MKKVTITTVVAAIGSILISGCSAFSTPGAPSGPDEFTVVSRAPLVVPPESNLRPPRPGVSRPQEIDPANRAMRAIFPRGTETPPPPSESEQALIKQISANVGTRVDADVRSNVGLKDMKVVKKTLILSEVIAAGERQHAPDNISVVRVGG